MKIKYIQNDDLYVIGETKYTKEEFIAYIQADMLRSVLKKGDKYVEIQPLYNENESIDLHNEIIENQEIPFPRNLIFFGAPGTGKSYKLNQNAQLYFNNNYERVTFHPNYMYGNFVGTYKPAMQSSNDELDSNIKSVVSILNDKTKTAQEKYDTLYDAFAKDQNISKLPLLVSLYCDDDFITKELDGSDYKQPNEKLRGTAIRKYVNLITEEAKKESIVYKYVPGPFMRVYVNAIKNKNTPHLLIIEEINRANVAAVFGDVFQLLDRNSAGESQYHIQTSEDMKNYLQKELGGSIDDYSTIKIPNNMYIWATMNNADQNVMPMDTAFKRMWDFHYLGINDAVYQNKDDFKKYKFKINSSEVVLWDDFRKELNSQLSQLNISEDKLIGPYFISKSVLDENDVDKTTSTIKDKVLMYLYDDVAKAYRSSLFAENKYSTYSELCKHFDQNPLSIFKNKLNVTSEPINNQSAKDVLNTSDNTNNS